MSATTKNPNATSSAPSVFGSYVWWEFLDSRITPVSLRSLVTKHAIDQWHSTPIADIDETSAVRSAAKAWKTGRGKADRYRSDVSFEDDDVIVVGILRREQKSTKKVGWDQIDSLVFDKNSNTWLSTGATEQARRFKQIADRDRVYLDHAEIRPIVTKIVESCTAAKLRRAGSFYFVPTSDETSAKLEALEAFVSEIGSSYLSVADQTATNAQRATGREVKAGLGEHLSALAEQISEWKKKVRSPRRDAVENLLEEFQALRDRSEVFADALKFKVDDLQNEITSVETIARGLLREDGEKGVSAGLVAILASLLDSKDEFEGAFSLDVEDFDGSGFPEAAWKNPAKYWTSNTAGRRALTSLGFVVREVCEVEDETLLIFEPIPSTDETSETETEES